MSNLPRLRILVVDDDPDVRAIILLALKDSFEVVTCTSGVEALERIDRLEPDLIVMDVMMPVLTGIETVRAIKKDARFSNVPVIFLTARTDNEAVREAMRVGGDFYVIKPFDPAALRTTVEQVAQTHRLVPQPKRHSLETLNRPIGAHTGRANTDLGANVASAPEAFPNEQLNDAERERRNVTPSATRRVRVMIVDDDVDVVNYVKSILREDYEIIGVADSELAPEKIVNYQPDIILLDIMMPKLNGFHLSHLIRINRRLRGSKIIFVSSRTDHEAISKAFSLGATDYLEKPFTPEQLRRKILAVTQQADFICPKKRINYMEILRREGEL
ncbi:MAG: response regulator [Candidatus Sumerlaeaceae bacterium]|nr:response regulator [Candidatus Sumerlaeaceae bacterium]